MMRQKSIYQKYSTVSCYNFSRCVSLPLSHSHERKTKHVTWGIFWYTFGFCFCLVSLSHTSSNCIMTPHQIWVFGITICRSRLLYAEAKKAFEKPQNTVWNSLLPYQLPEVSLETQRLINFLCSDVLVSKLGTVWKHEVKLYSTTS